MMDSRNKPRYDNRMAHSRNALPLPLRPDVRTQTARRPYILFFDGKCGLCVRSRDWLAARTPPDQLDFIDVHDERAMAAFPHVDREQALESVTLLLPDGSEAIGYGAATDAMNLVRGGRWFAKVMRFAPVRFVGRRMYRFVTRRRHRLSRLLGWA